jgi:hypothetical protein
VAAAVLYSIVHFVFDILVFSLNSNFCKARKTIFFEVGLLPSDHTLFYLHFLLYIIMSGEVPAANDDVYQGAIGIGG